jgi:membrane fusion protein, multidrug efflux system
MTTLEMNRLEAAADTALDARNKLRRKRLLLSLAIGLAIGGAAYAGYSHWYGSKFVSTDNAYTAAETAQVTPAIAGIVREVRVTDTQQVKRGDVVVVIDDTDAQLALAQAEAELGRAERRVRGFGANDKMLAAQLSARTADEKHAAAQLAAAKADFERARIDLQRRESLAASGAISGDELTKTRNAFASAQANVAAALAMISQAKHNHAAAVSSREANAVLIADATEETNPEVALARARRDQARVNLERTLIRAPIDGAGGSTDSAGRRGARGGAARRGARRCQLQGSATRPRPDRAAGGAGL